MAEQAATRSPAAAALPAAQQPRAKGRTNWPLWIGGLLVLLVLYIAWDGPALAPRDPLEETFVARNQAGVWVKPPYAPLAIPGFPLGADNFGRDILSQLLWAVRPTMTLVLVVAAVRLALGIVIGLAAGWSQGPAGRGLDALISAALAAPVLFVALCVIAALGVELGVWAFIIGLTLTGWGEAARLLREQTSALKDQPYIEAARALGESDYQVLFRHVLPQVIPLVWIMLAFEVSSTLLTTAGLGFLGYFINAIWIPLGDWSGIRASGKPELGQMLATASEAQSQPWGLAVAGSMVFITVLGFNLLGEGLRQQTSLDRLRKRDSRLSKAAGSVFEWIENRLFDPLSSWRRTSAMAAALGGLFVLIVGGGIALWRSQTVERVVGDLPVPGGHLWAAERHDAYGTLRADVAGPTSPVVDWTFRDPSGFSGGPVVAADGTVYLATLGGRLYALSPAGQEIWQAQLPQPAVGSPALSELGDIYVADAGGGLSAFTPEGTARWNVPGAGYSAVAGPIIGPDGVAYYPSDGHITAVTVDGNLKWRTSLPFYAYTSPLLVVSPDGEYVYFEDVALSAKDGAVLTTRTLEPLDKYFVGTDGKVYLGGPNSLLEWRSTEAGVEIVERARWDTRSLALGFRFMHSAGVTPEQQVWLFFTSEFEFGKMLWLDMAGEVRSVVDYPYRPSRMVAVDRNSIVYMCGFSLETGPECRALESESRDPLWKLPLDEAGFINGGALANDRLYLTTLNGVFYALASGQAAR